MSWNLLPFAVQKGNRHEAGEVQKSSCGVFTHPVEGSQASVVQSMLSSQIVGENWHRPVDGSQASSVQALLSSQLTGVFTHCPVEGSQESVVHRLPSSQLMRSQPDAQAPATQVSPAQH